MDKEAEFLFANLAGMLGADSLASMMMLGGVIEKAPEVKDWDVYIKDSDGTIGYAEIFKREGDEFDGKYKGTYEAIMYFKARVNLSAPTHYEALDDVLNYSQNTFENCPTLLDAVNAIRRFWFLNPVDGFNVLPSQTVFDAVTNFNGMPDTIVVEYYDDPNHPDNLCLEGGE